MRRRPRASCPRRSRARRADHAGFERQRSADRSRPVAAVPAIRQLLARGAALRFDAGQRASGEALATLPRQRASCSSTTRSGAGRRAAEGRQGRGREMVFSSGGGTGERRSAAQGAPAGHQGGGSRVERFLGAGQALCREAMTRIPGLLCAALIVAAAPAWGCINTFDEQQVFQRQGNTAAFEAIIRARKGPAPKPDARKHNDLGVACLLTGKMDAAIELLREAEKKFTGSARVAANLGTALELKGENKEALPVDPRKRDPRREEHHGSEWLHVRFLEAKIALAKNPRWFDKNTVLGYDFGTGDVPVAPEILPFEKGKLKGADELLSQMNWQLFERVKFVKPPDPTVGDLYASAGDLVIAGGLSPIDDGDQKVSGLTSRRLSTARRTRRWFARGSRATRRMSRRCRRRSRRKWRRSSSIHRRRNPSIQRAPVPDLPRGRVRTRDRRHRRAHGPSPSKVRE